MSALLDKKDFKIWLDMSEVGGEELALPCRLTLAVNALSGFLMEINPSHLPPQMRYRRESVLRRVWGDKDDI